MSKINELTEAQTEILDRLFWLDSNEEEDAAEIERLKHDLLKIRGDAQHTLEFLSGLLLESRAVLAGREDVKRRAEKRRKTAENAVNRLTKVCEHIMSRFEIDKIALEGCDMRIQMSPGAIEYAPNFDPATLPPDCYKLEFKPLAKELKAHIDAGASFDGVFLVKRETLRIS